MDKTHTAYLIDRECDCSIFPTICLVGISVTFTDQACINAFSKNGKKAINPFPNKSWFLRVCSTSLLKALWKKEKLLVKSNFSFSHSVFYQSEERSSIFFKSEIVVCKLLQFGQV